MSATNLITALRTETREDSITPSRIADILDAVLKEGGSGGSVPADLAERLDAVGITAANAKNTADAAKTAAESAKTAADTAKTAADSAKNTADSLKNSVSGLQTKVGSIPSIWTGSPSQFDAITNKDSKTLYFITES